MRANRFSSLSLLFFLGKWLLLAFIIAVLAGTASAFFLFSLQWATATREAHRWLIELLPLAGFAVGWIYLRYGTRVEAGNNLILEEIHDPQRVIPLRMAPLVFLVPLFLICLAPPSVVKARQCRWVPRLPTVLRPFSALTTMPGE